MSSSQYRVVSLGRIADGFSADQVTRNLQQIFNVDPDRAAGLFAEPGVVVKSGLPLDHAEKYVERLRGSGLLVSLEEEGMEALPQSDASRMTLEPREAQPASAAPAEAAALTAPAPAQPQPPAQSAGERRAAPVEFTGSGREYFGIWIVNILLTILTLGLYSAWATVRDKQYFYGNTRLDGSSFQYLADPWVIFRGRLIATAAVILWVVVSEFWLEAAGALVIAFVILLPWIVIRSLKFNAVNSAYRGVRFDFEGSYGQAFLVMLVWPLLGMITLFLAMPFSIFKSQQFMINGSRFGTTPFSLQATAGAYYRFFLKLLGIGAGFAIVAFAAGKIVDPILSMLVGAVGYLTLLGYLLAGLTNLVMNATGLAGHGFESRLGKRQMVWIYLTNSLLIGITLGLFTPWAKVRMARYRASCTQMLVDGDLNQFTAAEHSRTSAIGQELGDAFDVGFAPI